MITVATVELTGLPAKIWGGQALFESRTEAAAAAADVVRSGVDVAKIELFEDLSATMTNEYLDTDLPDGPMVFIEFYRNHGIEREVELCRSFLEVHGLLSFDIDKRDEK